MEASCAILAARGVSWAVMEALLSVREALWPPRHPPRVGAMQLVIRVPEGGAALRRLQKPCHTALGILARPIAASAVAD